MTTKQQISNSARAAVMLLTVCVAAIGPMLTILAINTLFETGIEITPATWFASFWISAAVFGRGGSGK